MEHYWNQIKFRGIKESGTVNTALVKFGGWGIGTKPVSPAPSHVPS